MVDYFFAIFAIDVVAIFRHNFPQFFRNYGENGENILSSFTVIF